MIASEPTQLGQAVVQPALTVPVGVLPFGGCVLRGPLNVAKADDHMRDGLKRLPYGGIPPTYTFGEMRQAVAVLRGELDVPQRIRPLCRMRPNLKPVDTAADFRNVDVALLEPATPMEITFRGHTLNQSALNQQVV